MQLLRLMLMRVLLTVFSLLALVVTVAIAVDEFGAGAPPWFGWWDATITIAGPYSLTIEPRRNGAAARSGFRAGDRVDLRRQSVMSRIAATYQPVTTQRSQFLVQRSGRVISLDLTPSTIWDNASFWKLQPMLSRLLANLLFIVSALLIALRRRNDLETNALAIAILLIVGTMLDPSFFVTPYASFALTSFLFSRACATGIALIFVWLSWRRQRSILAFLACVPIAVAFLTDVGVVAGLSTARIDPLPFILSISPARSALDAGVWMLVLLTAAYASLRTRSAWLLLPLPAGLFVSSLCFASPTFIHDWFANVAAPALSNIAVPLGVVLLTWRLRYGGGPPPVMAREAKLHA